MQQKAFNPETTCVHFRNAAAKAKFKAGTMTPSEARQAIIEVPVKRAIDRKTLKQMRNDWKYAAKINNPEWKAEAARRKGASEGQAGHE